MPALFWTINDFPRRRERCIKSRRFSFMSADPDIRTEWELHLLPHGDSSYSRDNVVLFVVFLSCQKAGDPQLSFNISISTIRFDNCPINSKTESVTIVPKNTVRFEFGRASLPEGKSGLLDEKLRIVCCIDLNSSVRLIYPSYQNVIELKERKLKWQTGTQEEIIMRVLSVDMWQMYVNQKHTDVLITVGSQKKGQQQFKAHKVVLAARSPVFAAMFDHDMQEANTNQVDISDVEPPVFLELLRFIYSGKVDNLETVASDLLVCAEKYGLEKLKNVCESAILTKISIEGAVDVLIFADRYKAQTLREGALNFIKEHCQEIIELEQWKTMFNHPRLLTEVLSLTASQ